MISANRHVQGPLGELGGKDSYFSEEVTPELGLEGLGGEWTRWPSLLEGIVGRGR